MFKKNFYFLFLTINFNFFSSSVIKKNLSKVKENLSKVKNNFIDLKNVAFKKISPKKAYFYKKKEEDIDLLDYIIEKFSEDQIIDKFNFFQKKRIFNDFLDKNDLEIVYNYFLEKNKDKIYKKDGEKYLKLLNNQQEVGDVLFEIKKLIKKEEEINPEEKKFLKFFINENINDLKKIYETMLLIKNYDNQKNSLKNKLYKNYINDLFIKNKEFFEKKDYKIIFDYLSFEEKFLSFFINPKDKDKDKDDKKTININKVFFDYKEADEKIKIGNKEETVKNVYEEIINFKNNIYKKENLNEGSINEMILKLENLEIYRNKKKNSLFELKDRYSTIINYAEERKKQIQESFDEGQKKKIEEIILDITKVEKNKNKSIFDGYFIDSNTGISKNIKSEIDGVLDKNINVLADYFLKTHPNKIRNTKSGENKNKLEFFILIPLIIREDIKSLKPAAAIKIAKTLGLDKVNVDFSKIGAVVGKAFSGPKPLNEFIHENSNVENFNFLKKIEIIDDSELYILYDINNSINSFSGNDEDKKKLYIKFFENLFKKVNFYKDIFISYSINKNSFDKSFKFVDYFKSKFIKENIFIENPKNEILSLNRKIMDEILTSFFLIQKDEIKFEVFNGYYNAAKNLKNKAKHLGQNVWNNKGYLISGVTFLGLILMRNEAKDKISKIIKDSPAFMKKLKNRSFRFSKFLGKNVLKYSEKLPKFEKNLLKYPREGLHKIALKVLELTK